MADITELDKRQIEAMIANYERKGVEYGGKWPLSALRWELSLREPPAYEIVPLCLAIVRLCKRSDDARVSYGDLWIEMNNVPLPKGQAWAKPLTNSLGHVGAYCVEHGLPLLSTLVVNDQTRSLTDKAAYNIWSYLKDRGAEVGADPRAYVVNQAALAMGVLESQIKETPELERNRPAHL